MPLLTLQDVTLGFRGPPLLDGVDFQIDPGERVSLLGRNGEGKTTLMRILHGELEPDAGEIVRPQNVTTALLTQQVPTSFCNTIFDEVADGLGELGIPLAEFHHTSVQFAAEPSDALRRQLDRLQRTLDARNGWQVHQEVEKVLSRMDLDAEAKVDSLSAGMKRRVLLAKALVRQPEVLLLDEPTNHLDVDAIAWLEEFLMRFGGTILFVTHDRVFLKKIATRIVELDRGRLTSWSCDYPTFLKRKEAALKVEAVERAQFDKRLAQEEAWIRRGVLARRTRNEGRVRRLMKMRQTRTQRRERPDTASLQLQEAERSGRLVIKANGISHAFGENRVLENFSTVVMRGDRIGLIGPNGSGKTTLLRILLDQLEPDQGTIRHGTRLEPAYFDQLHRQLDLEKSVEENIGSEGQSIMIQGRKRHVLGYLQDFLFSPEQARMPVKFLSGGERNRLLLARLFSKPSNVLVLDEPTNDLDIETLELLEENLLEYSGTLLLVSHDREFLNNVVTSTLVFEGSGRVKEYDGGYDDWIRQRTPEKTPTVRKPKNPTKRPSESNRPKSRQLKYAEKIELDTLPDRIESLEKRIDALHQVMADPAFYQQDRSEIVRTTSQLESLEKELADAFERWEKLEALRS